MRMQSYENIFCRQAEKQLLGKLHHDHQYLKNLMENPTLNFTGYGSSHVPKKVIWLKYWLFKHSSNFCKTFLNLSKMFYRFWHVQVKDWSFWMKGKIFGSNKSLYMPVKLNSCPLMPKMDLSTVIVLSRKTSWEQQWTRIASLQKSNE